MLNKYFKPKSVTWWASMAPLVAGLIVAGSDAVPELKPLADFVDSVTGGTAAFVLINAGLAGIGLRGAV